VPSGKALSVGTEQAELRCGVWREWEWAGGWYRGTATGLNTVCYRQYPVDGQFERLPDGQEVDEDPDNSSDEADYGDE